MTPILFARELNYEPFRQSRQRFTFARFRPTSMVKSFVNAKKSLCQPSLCITPSQNQIIYLSKKTYRKKVLLEKEFCCFRVSFYMTHLEMISLAQQISYIMCLLFSFFLTSHPLLLSATIFYNKKRIM
jgi:hypothetical protein